MAEYILSPEALDDLQSIWDFIANDSPQAADRVLDELFAAFEHLAEWPGSGHTRHDLTRAPVRFWPVRSYLVVIARAQFLCKLLPSCMEPGTFRPSSGMIELISCHFVKIGSLPS